MAARKSGLGRGLDALFESVPVREERKSGAEGILYVDIDDISPNRNQPRKDFDEEKLEGMAASIKEYGIIQPVVLRKKDRGYEIVAGERRYRAARKAGLKKIPCVIRDLTEEQNLLVAIIENMQREDLNPIEEAEGLNRMAEVYGLTQEAISKSVGKSRPYITNSLRLLKLPQRVREMTADGSISAGHARAIAGIDDPERQIYLAEKAAGEGLSVRELEKLVAGGGAKKNRGSRDKDPDTARLESELGEIFGTRVSVSGSPEKGKIELDYYTREDLERLLEMFRNM